MGQAARGIGSANHWLSSIRTKRLSWYLTMVGVNQASSNSVLVVGHRVSLLLPLLRHAVCKFLGDVLFSSMDLESVTVLSRRCHFDCEVHSTESHCLCSHTTLFGSFHMHDARSPMTMGPMSNIMDDREALRSRKTE